MAIDLVYSNPKYIRIEPKASPLQTPTIHTRTVGYNIRLWEVMHVECLLTAQGRG